ncbi:MAG: glycosyltransferase [archaeon]
MIIIVANTSFPSNNAMSLRIGREAEILSKNDEVTVVCRREKHQNSKESISLEGKEINVERFDLNYVDPKSPYYVPFFSEAFRAIRTFFALFFVIAPLLRKNNDARIHAVNSPETIPLSCYLTTMIFGGKAFVARFDDLGPELSGEAKGISENSLIIKINKSIEGFICNKYERIISYSDGITEQLIKRNKIGRDKITTLMMTPRKIKRSTQSASIKSVKDKKPFLLAYTGTLQNYGFILKGFNDLFFSLQRVKEKGKEFTLIIAGEGNAKKHLMNLSKEFGLEENVLFKGELNEKEIDSLLLGTDATVIPLPCSSHMLHTFPTKILKYLAFGKVIIAPNYGEFSRHFNNKENAVLYNERSKLDLSNRLIEVMEDKNLRKKIEKNSLKLFETKFNQTEMEERLRKIYSIN